MLDDKGKSKPLFVDDKVTGERKIVLSEIARFDIFILIFILVWETTARARLSVINACTSSYIVPLVETNESRRSSSQENSESAWLELSRVSSFETIIIRFGVFRVSTGIRRSLVCRCASSSPLAISFN